MQKETPAELLAALRNAKTYPHSADPIEHLETHISHVFLAGDYAYKLKKPVNFGFLDFTTNEQRRAACMAEVRLNRRLAPDIYLGIASLCRENHALRLRPDNCPDGGTAIEPLVRMRRLPSEGMLDRLAMAGRLDTNSMIDIARQLAAFHRQAARDPDIRRHGEIEAVRQPVLQNFDQTRDYIGRVVSADVHARLRSGAEGFLRSHASLFAERVRGGHIVDGHGDLHLRNMCRVDGRVVIFDCIEFNTALRAADTISDIAFLTMDLDHRGLTTLGNRFLNEYLELTGDYPGVRLLDFYQSYRACVRAKVMALASDGAAPDQRRAIEQESASYFDLAEQYLRPRRPGILLTCGVSGSGKSTLARRAAAELNGIVVRSDAVRKQLAGLALHARDDSAPGQGIYTPAMTARTYGALHEQARALLASGRWVILDAVFGKREERAAVSQLARRLGAAFGILHCQAPRPELERRLELRRATGGDISDATSAVLDRQLERFEVPEAREGALFNCSGDEDPSVWLATLRARN